MKTSKNTDILECLIVDFIHCVRVILNRLGGRKLWLLHMQLFPKYGHKTVGRDRFLGIMCSHNLKVPLKKSDKPHGTYSKHGYAVKPNLIKDLELTTPNQVWVTDVTWILVSTRWCYLALVTDKYSRMIVGWELGENHSHILVQRAVNKALTKNKSHEPIILHSDRGSENCCHELINFLREKGVVSSMTDADHCAQNALAERQNGILKQEFVPVQGYAFLRPAKAALSYSINLYNTARPHSALHMLTPIQVHKGDYDCHGNKIKGARGNTKSAAEVIESLLNNSPLFMQIKREAMS